MGPEVAPPNDCDEAVWQMVTSTSEAKRTFRQIEQNLKGFSADFRAAAKIAFNYLAFVAGAAFVLEPQFNEVRRFVRQGVQLPWAPVKPKPNPWLLANSDGEPLVGHYVVIRTRGQVIECDVCLLMRTRYRVSRERESSPHGKAFGTVDRPIGTPGGRSWAGAA